MPEERRELPDRNLALELVRVTEAAAIAASTLIGRGDEKAADAAAVEAMLAAGVTRVADETGEVDYEFATPEA